MHTETGFTTLSAMREITRDVIEAVADRPGDLPARRLARQQTTASTMISFRPRDPVETMLAGQCVIFDHLLRDGAQDTLRGQQQEIKLRARPQILATGKMFLAHLDRLEQMQSRLDDRFAVQPPSRQAASPAAGASGQGDAADSSAVDPSPPPAHTEPAEPATTPAVAGAASHAHVASEAAVASPARVEANPGTPLAGKAADSGPPVGPAEQAHQGLTQPVPEPAGSQAVAAQTADLASKPTAPPDERPGTSSPRPNILPDLQAGSHAELQRSQPPAVSGQGGAPVVLRASAGVSPSPGSGKPPAAARA
jgi:hypothetical protein